jgi:hypothetical protein
MGRIAMQSIARKLIGFEKRLTLRATQITPKGDQISHVSILLALTALMSPKLTASGWPGDITDDPDEII